MAQISLRRFLANQLALVPRLPVGANNSFIHGELLKGQRELNSALPAMASLTEIDPKPP
jgi:hypothetical protein